jgi:hypothetical protein
MTDDTPSGPDGEPVSRLDAAVEVFDTFRDEMAALLHEVRQGETARARRLAPIVTELGRAVGQLAREARHAEDEQRRSHEHGEGGALDLDAARAEIGRRLARLRAVRSGGEVPAGSD